MCIALTALSAWSVDHTFVLRYNTLFRHSENLSIFKIFQKAPQITLFQGGIWKMTIWIVFTYFFLFLLNSILMTFYMNM